jgi:hypothetical protein
MVLVTSRSLDAFIQSPKRSWLTTGGRSKESQQRRM